jgi:hypothetical protein
MVSRLVGLRTVDSKGEEPAKRAAAEQFQAVSD